MPPFTAPPPTPAPTNQFTTIVSGYAINWTIIKVYSGAYNIVVYANYPPFPIQVTFYDDTQQVTQILPTYGTTTTIFSENYPTQVTMTKYSSVTPSPT